MCGAVFYSSVERARFAVVFQILAHVGALGWVIWINFWTLFSGFICGVIKPFRESPKRSLTVSAQSKLDVNQPWCRDFQWNTKKSWLKVQVHCSIVSDIIVVSNFNSPFFLLLISLLLLVHIHAGANERCVRPWKVMIIDRSNCVWSDGAKEKKTFFDSSVSSVEIKRLKWKWEKSRMFNFTILLAPALSAILRLTLQMHRTHKSLGVVRNVSQLAKKENEAKS